MMASFGKRLTRFVAAQTIRAVQIRILRVLGKGLCSAHDISDQALWPKLQGKLNREWRIYRMDLPFWQSGKPFAAWRPADSAFDISGISL